MRHGRAAAGWADAEDPPLDPVGVEQAAVMAATLAPLGPLPIVVSPLRRTRETAAPLEARWGTSGRVDAGVGELKAPVDGLQERHDWLVRAFSGTWVDVEPQVREWRQRVLDALLALERDTVVVTHFVAINATVGAAIGDDRFVCFRPDNCSCTVVDHDGTTLRLVERGADATTTVVQ